MGEMCSWRSSAQAPSLAETGIPGRAWPSSHGSSGLIRFPFSFLTEPRSYVESVARTATTGRGGTLPTAQPGGPEVPARNGTFTNSFTAPSPVSTSSPIHSVDG